MKKDMKTLFNKIQNYKGGDLTERPSQWPERAERIETTAKEMGHALQVLNKRISACMQTDSRYDNTKRARKMKESKYAEAMIQTASQFTCSYLLNHAFRSLGEVGRDLADERFNYELAVDQLLAYFREVELSTLPTLSKHCKHLSRACTDLRIAREKLRHLEALPNDAAAQTKLEEANRRVVEGEKRVAEMEKVTLSHLYSFDNECQVYTSNLVELLKHLDNYHRKCLMILEEKIPLIEKDITFRTFSPVFECSLMQHLEETKREIAFPLEKCVQALNTDEALREEGLFRLTGSKARVDMLKRALTSMSDDVEQILLTVDAHSVADTLKQYLRGLPEPLLKAALFDDWAAAVKIADHEARLNAVQSCLSKLPQDHFSNLKFLICFMHRVAEHSAENKMSPRNLGIVLGPSMLWRKQMTADGSDMNPSNGEHSAAVPNEAVTILIENAPLFFPDGELIPAVSAGMALRAASSNMRRSSGLGRRQSVPDSPLFPVARPLNNRGLRRWPASGSSSALYSSTRRPGTLGAPQSVWGHPGTPMVSPGHLDTPQATMSRNYGLSDHESNRRYQSMTSINTRQSVGEGVVLDIRQPEDYQACIATRSSRFLQRANSQQIPYQHQLVQQQHHQQQEMDASSAKRSDLWKSSTESNGHASYDRRRYTSQQQLHSQNSDFGIRVQTMPRPTVTSQHNSSINGTTTSSNFKRTNSVDTMRKERTVLEVQVNGKNRGSLTNLPIEVKILPEKGETRL